MKGHLDRFVRWLYPGLGVKRWLVLAACGAVLAVDGVERWITAYGAHFEINEHIDNIFDGVLPLWSLAPIFAFVGLILVVLGIRLWLRSIVRAVRPEGKNRIVDALFNLRLRRGYKIVAIGGGTGLSTLLRGLKRGTSNLTAIVTVSDDGGSSGRLQKELGILPPGDIRNCLVALADNEALVTALFQYRFSEGEGLAGHSFGNLFLAAMTGITGNFDSAIKESSRVLNIKGRVVPSTLDSVQLKATFADGTSVLGETNVSSSREPIIGLELLPAHVRAFGEALTAIREADAIVLGPGSLFTSILPNLLIPKIVREIAASSAAKIYVCNVMTQPGETDHMSAYDHVSRLFDVAGARVCDIAIVNVEPPRRLLGAYAEEGQAPVHADVKRIEALGIRVLSAPVISETVNVRHDPEKLADVVLRIVDDHVALRSSYTRGASRPSARTLLQKS
ncbi:MAG TPA: YvcK family protein [Candidatus Baltobacteraceae bacterium]|jgi:uncharacterized cofD-like protein|nr:YvcK family protein [Candidatus Baltobacteraceae bacterium]